MGKRKTIIFLVLVIFANAKEYTITNQAIEESKNIACKKALDNARSEALFEAGTFVISEFDSTNTLNGNKVTKNISQHIKNISAGLVKVTSKQEKITITKDYQFICKITATFDIDENSIKKAIQEYKNSLNSNQYITAEGYSDIGQSRYRAIRAAILDAKRNLLSSNLLSTTISNDGKLTKDEIIEKMQGKLRFVKIIKTTILPDGSAKVIVGIKKSDLK